MHGTSVAVATVRGSITAAGKIGNDLLNLLTQVGEKRPSAKATSRRRTSEVSARPGVPRRLGNHSVPKGRMKERGKDRLEKATYQAGDYGRMIRPDGTEQWWVKLPKGIWIALRHQRVMPNEDGSITLLSLEI